MAFWLQKPPKICRITATSIKKKKNLPIKQQQGYEQLLLIFAD